jgi:hypothetical protein
MPSDVTTDELRELLVSRTNTSLHLYAADPALMEHR